MYLQICPSPFPIPYRPIPHFFCPHIISYSLSTLVTYIHNISLFHLYYPYLFLHIPYSHTYFLSTNTTYTHFFYPHYLFPRIFSYFTSHIHKFKFSTHIPYICITTK